MKTKTLLKVATQSIQKNKLRATLTMLGIIIGVAAVIVMVAVGYGARSRIKDQINNLGTNMIVITPGAQNTSGVSQGAQAFANLKLDDIDKIRRESQYVSAISPVVVSRSQVLGPQGNWRTAINGVDPDFQTIRNWETQSGTFFSEDDVRAGRTVAVIGQTVANQLFSDSDPVGQTLQIGKVPFTVMGELTSKGQTASGSDSDDVILVPYTTATTRLSGRQFIPQILASTSSEQDIPAAQNEIKSILEESHKITDGNDDFTVRNQTDLAQAATSSTQVMTLLMASIASISLLVGGIGIMNIMLVSVTERTREIGLRMAVGARGRDILLQFLVEAITLSLIGGIIGIVFGLGGSRAISYLAEWRTLVSMEAIVLAFGFAALIGIFFRFYPARKAARLDPIEALRYE